jgi:hypothetical protein
MTLSTDAVKRLKTAVTSNAVGAELAAAIDASGSGPAALVAALAASTNLPAAACAGAATPSATNVNAAIDTVSAVAETRLDNLEIKVNAILAALKAANLMASS